MHLNGNQLTTLSAEIGQLTGLTGLHLDDNKLSTLPAEIVQLTCHTRLTRLVLGAKDSDQLLSKTPALRHWRDDLEFAGLINAGSRETLVYVESPASIKGAPQAAELGLKIDVKPVVQPTQLLAIDTVHVPHLCALCRKARAGLGWGLSQ